MSVINKMLRDLDSRQTGDAAAGAEASVGTGFTRDTRVVSRLEQGVGRRPGKAVWLSALLILLAGAAAAWWYQTQRAAPLSSKPPTRIGAAPQAARNAVASEPVGAPVRALTTPILVAATRPAGVSSPLATSLPVPAPATGRALSQADFSLKMDNTLRLPTASASQAKPVAMVTTPITRASPDRAAAVVPFSAPALVSIQPTVRQSGADEVLVQAQSLWNRGSHEAALDLLGEALVLAERANAAGAPSGSASVVAALTRELARMELAQGRVSQALALLIRLEPVLADSAEIWALRGNAAQRLGRHAESAAAYLTALRLKPNEPRWLLGAAVSLAAQGQIAAATEMAEKARTGGVLSPEVAAYLRQLGVKLPEH